MDTEMADENGNIVLDQDPLNNSNQEAMPTPMEGVAATAPAANPLQGEYTWELRDFSKQDPKVLSEVFEIGGYSWQLLCFPRGNSKEHQLSLYLAVPNNEEEQPLGWQRSASFKLTLINQLDTEQSGLVKDTRHTFTQRENDWGFTSFLSLNELLEPSKGYVVNDTIKIKVEITVNAPEDVALYDSRKETGFVGLKNQGATCYMNSLLQTMYNINEFRKSVYHMPTAEDADPANSMPLALQSVFYKLQFTDGPVSTKDLTRSFGWDTSDAFQQHDVQELARILCDRLEEKMKGTRVEGMVNKLFEGHVFNYIECINVDCKSTRTEAFQDLQLDVKGCKNIYESFDKYCDVEVLDGDNKYEAEGHGKQAARKGVLFDDVPPVLQLQLKRFEYDYMKDMMIKINDRYEFYEELDLDKLDENGKRKYLSPNSDRNKNNKYRLLAVMVHSGGVHGGHYYAYVRPDGKKWLKFDDERVEVADHFKAVEENYGGDDEKPPPTGYGHNPIRLSKFSNAYMLVYVRESEWDNIMCDVTQADISEHVRARLVAEQAEKERRRKEKAEAHLYTLVRVATDEDLAAQIGHDRFFDLVDMDKVGTCLKMPKKAPFSEVLAAMAKKTGVPPEQQRYWKWVGRQNGTVRPNVVLELSNPEATIVSLQDSSTRARSNRPGEMAKLDLFLETPLPPATTLPPITSPQNSILLLLKHYHPEPQAGRHIKYAGRMIANTVMTPTDISPVLLKKLGYPAGTKLEIYEEVKMEPTVMVDAVKMDESLGHASLESGDILVVQRELSLEEAAVSEFPHAPDFLKDVRNRLVVSFHRLESPQEEAFSLELLKDMSYDDVCAAVAKKLGLDHPLKVRLTGHSMYSQLPRQNPFKYTYMVRDKSCLEDMLKGPGQYGGQLFSSILYFDVLDLPLPEYEQLVTFKISFHNSKHEDTHAVTCRLPRDKTVADLLEHLREQIPKEAHQGKPLRLMEVYQWKIWQLFDPKGLLSDVGENLWHLRAEVVPEDQLDLEEQGVLHVQCHQVTSESEPNMKVFPFSDPFIMKIGIQETVGQLKQRVQAELEVPDEEFKEWKAVLLLHLAAPEELDDSVVITQRINPTDLAATKLYGHTDRPVIGFQHTNKNPRKTHAHLNRNPSQYGQERQLKIRA